MSSYLLPWGFPQDIWLSLCVCLCTVFVLCVCYFEVAMKVRNVSLKLFMQYLSGKNGKSNSFYKSYITTRKQPNSLFPFLSFILFFSSRVFVICSGLLTCTHSIYFVGKIPEMTYLYWFMWTEQPHTNWTFGLFARTEFYGRVSATEQRMESLVTENAASEASTKSVELSPVHTTSWKSAW